LAGAIAAGLAAACLWTASRAMAVAPPVGPLPASSVTQISTARGSLVALAVPRRSVASGLVWRVARRFDAGVVRQISEAEAGTAIVLVFKAIGRGRTSIVLALTRGESPKAFRAARYAVRVS
jgi:hypothetical protein